MRPRFVVPAIASTVLLLAGAGPAAAAKLKLDPQLLARGKVVYERECAVCHGDSGKGDGEAAYLLFPRPRDFTSNVFKIRTSLPGQPPRRGDIVRTLQLGLPGSTMPSFVSLPQRDLQALAEYVLSLTGFEEEAEEFVEIPRVPPSTPEWIAKGKLAYAKYECFKCHGEKGDGKGPSAPTLRDYKKRPIRPNDYTRGVFKGGGDARSIIARILTGVEGTPMPSHADVIENKEDLIALAHYVRHFSRGRDFWQPSTGVIPARRIQGGIPDRTDDPRWAEVDPVPIPMMQLNNDGRPPIEVKVRAVHDERRISILLEWEDETVDRNLLTNRSFGDAAAVQFSLREQDPPLFVMGARDNLVNIWYWNAAAGEKLADVEARYPGMASDDYPFAGKAYPRPEMGHAKEIVPARATRAPFISAWAVGNPTSAPGKVRAFMDLNAAGFGTLQPQGTEGQNVEGAARWRKGLWRVVYTRTLESGEKNDVPLLSGSIHPVAFAVWNGRRGDRDGQKSVTTWYKLRIE